MKKMCILLLFIAAGMYAADSSSGLSEEVVMWDSKAEHNGDGVHIAISVKGSIKGGLETQFVEMLSHSLALQLEQDQNYQKASYTVQSVLQACETKAKDVKVEAFFERMKNALSGSQPLGCRNFSINKMLLTVALAKSGVKLKVEGSVEPGKCQTFFPPYTLVSEGATQITPVGTSHVFFAMASSPMTPPLMGIYD